MNCENCGKNQANVKYTQIINGNKREMFLCSSCSKQLGIENLNISMDFSSFLEDFFAGFEEDLSLKLPEIRCNRCNSTFESFISTGKFRCEDCYSTFEEKIDPLLRNIQGANRHIGRLGEINDKVNEKNVQSQNNILNSEIDRLKHELKLAIKDEKYEEAAIIRDKIKKLEGEN